MKRIGRAQWKISAVLTAILVVGVTGPYLLIHKARERKTFLGNVDPVSGYRCRFTLSPVWNWHVKTGLTGNRQGSPPSFGNHGDFDPGDSPLDGADFTFPRPASPSGPLSQWLSLHFFPKTVPAKTPKIGLFSCPLKDFPGHTRLVRGYPEFVGEGEGTVPKHTQSHLLIDGCPATIMDFTSFPDSPGPYSLIVYDSKSDLLYCVGGVAEEGESAWFHREMQAIIASFHIEKASFPAGRH